MELLKLSQLFQVSLEKLMAANDAAEETDQAVKMMFRRYKEIAPDVETYRSLRHCTKLCRHATKLEEKLGLTSLRSIPPSYPLATPETRWEAIEQGTWLAEQERRRLQLGNLPVRHLVEIIGRQGVRIAKHDLPLDIAGLFFISPGTGPVIIANAQHVASRRLFSYAHELCHLIVDRERFGTATTSGNREDLSEMRANSFAAHFLMPEAGVRSFLEDFGRTSVSRQVLEVLDSWSAWTDCDSALSPSLSGVSAIPPSTPLSAQRRSPSSTDIQVIHVVLLSQHFGTSYEATLYQLLNLKLLSKDHFNRLIPLRDMAQEIMAFLFCGNGSGDIRNAGTDQTEPEGRGNLHSIVLSLCLDACGRRLLSQEEMDDIMEDLNVPVSLRRHFRSLCASPKRDI